MQIKPPTVIRFKDNPIIRPDMLAGRDGVNIAGPSLIAAPPWLTQPLGKYYLYFADHSGKYIRLACADALPGPWRIYGPGTLSVEQVVAVAKAIRSDDPTPLRGNHVASPDVHVDDQNKQIRMYFHYNIAPKELWGHRSAVAISSDGIHFEPVRSMPLGEPYFRVFRWQGRYYAVNRSAAVAESADGLGNFVIVNPQFADAVGHNTRGVPIRPDRPEIRHTAMKLDGNLLTVFFSRLGDLPEIIMMSQADLSGPPATWRLSPPVTVLTSQMDYEGAAVPLHNPTNGELQQMPRPLYRELRDPCIYREGDKTYLLYCVAGEGGIALAELKD